MTLSNAAVDRLYEQIIPFCAFSATITAVLLLVRSAIAMMERVRGRLARAAGVTPEYALPKYGRKGLLVTACGVLFCTSCAYRSHNVADEGAFLCRGPATPFNAPWAGRLVATIGELSLAVQMSTYLQDTAQRLSVPSKLFAARSRTLPLAVVAELLSWTGVLVATPTFFCLEYICWMVIGAMWAYDAAELLHRSRAWGDSAVHALIVVVSLGLLGFNAMHELPHFFAFDASATSVAAAADSCAASRGNAWRCEQDKDSPLWLSRLPFFASYFVGCSWFSTSLSARYYLHGSEKGGKGALRSRLAAWAGASLGVSA